MIIDRNALAFRPEVSILMTVWNGEAYLSEAIDSVLEQRTSVPWELIVVDDGSIDSSLSVVRRYCGRYPGCIRLLRHPGGANRGISASRNLALQAARAPVVAFLDCDDVFLPHHLHTQVAVLHRHPEVAMVYASAERWVDHAAPFDRVAAEGAWWGSNYLPPLTPLGEHGGVLQPGTLLRWMLQDESLAPCMCTVLVRREMAVAVRGFENEFAGLYDDQVFHSKLSACFPVYANPDCTARYRQHPTSCCARAHTAPEVCETENRHFQAWLERFCLEKKNVPAAVPVEESVAR